MKHFDNSSQISELVEMILGSRNRPLVVVSTTDAGGEFGFDPQHIESELGTDADVVTITTGAATYAMEELLPPKTHVFNGAARSYPPSFGEDPSYQRSILRFPNLHKSEDLVNDALAQISLTSLFEPVRRAEWVKGTVERVFGATGNIALLDDGRRVLINADRLTPDISLSEALTEGGPVEGWLYDLDLSPELANPDLERFTHESVTLARVIKVTSLRATLSLHPLLPSIVLRKREVLGEGDDVQDVPVSDVVHVGQTVRANVHVLDESIKLSLVDVDEDAPLVESLSLLRGGLPWLQEGVDAPVESAPLEDNGAPTVEEDINDTSNPELQQASMHEGPAEPSKPGTAEAGALSFEVQAIHGEMVALRGAFERFSREMRAGTPLETLDQLRDELSSTHAELHREREARSELRQMVSRLTQELREARSGAQAQAPLRAVMSSSRDQWHDDELWLRHELQNAWALRTSAHDKRAYPVKDYKIGAELVESLTQLEDKSLSKAMRAIVDVVTGRVTEIPARELHQLRTGRGGDDPHVQRSDGALCWRVSLESNTPQARRLHFWRLPDGGVELSRVVLHDDFKP